MIIELEYFWQRNPDIIHKEDIDIADEFKDMDLDIIIKSFENDKNKKARWGLGCCVIIARKIK